MPKDKFHLPTDFPEELSRSQNGFSVDVLIYSRIERIHTIGFYNFNLFRWHFLTNEDVNKEFKWRYFEDEIDKPSNNHKNKKSTMAAVKTPTEIENGVTIEATLIRETKDSYYLDCEGDPTWFPKSKVIFDSDKSEVEVPSWLMKEKFPNENF
jgi:hypothetical protein